MNFQKNSVVLEITNLCVCTCHIVDSTPHNLSWSCHCLNQMNIIWGFKIKWRKGKMNIPFGSNVNNEKDFSFVCSKIYIISFTILQVRKKQQIKLYTYKQRVAVKCKRRRKWNERDGNLESEIVDGFWVLAGFGCHVFYCADRNCIGYSNQFFYKSILILSLSSFSTRCKYIHSFNIFLKEWGYLII